MSLQAVLQQQLRLSAYVALQYLTQVQGQLHVVVF